MSLSYYIAGCVMAGLCGLMAGMILVLGWRSRPQPHRAPEDITAEDLR